MLMNYIESNYGLNAVVACKENDTSYTKYNKIKDFNNCHNNYFIFLTMPKCCGLNLNLPEISCVFIFDSHLNYVSDLAALSQASQIGHDDILPIFRLFISDSVDHKILTLSHKKSAILTKMFLTKNNYIQGKTKLSSLDEHISNKYCIRIKLIYVILVKYDFKLLEEMLICSNQYLKDKSIEKDDFDLYMPDLSIKAASCRNLGADDVKAILDQSFRIKEDRVGRNGHLSGPLLDHIHYAFKYCQFIDLETSKLNYFYSNY